MVYVALLDILGFKDLINNNSHSDVKTMFDQFRLYLQMSLAESKTATDKWGQLTFDIKQAKINSNIVSDSLIFWTNDNSTGSLFNLIDCVYALTRFCHNQRKLFLRGGLTCGEFYFQPNFIKNDDGSILSNHPIMVGKALVDVYEIEKKLEVAGCVLTDQVMSEAEKNDGANFKAKWDDYIAKHKLVKYPVPTKKDALECWTINWVWDAPNPTAEALAKGFEADNKKVNSESVQIKIKNTLDYYHYVRTNILKVK